MTEWLPIAGDGGEWLPLTDDGAEWGTIIVDHLGNIIFSARSYIRKEFEAESTAIIAYAKGSAITTTFAAESAAAS